MALLTQPGSKGPLSSFVILLWRMAYFGVRGHPDTETFAKLVPSVALRRMTTTTKQSSTPTASA